MGRCSQALQREKLCAIWVTAKNNSSHSPPPEDGVPANSLVASPLNLVEAGKGGWAAKDVRKRSWIIGGRQRWGTAVLSQMAPGLGFEWEEGDAWETWRQ